jgi:adenosylcobinamide kinase/adenosylcobinamide-phosphate guanylyltransferase
VSATGAANALWFVTGGARSGKSRFAERLAAATDREVVYIATMEPLDAELVERVAAHRASRPAAWATVEAPLDLVGALSAAAPAACVLIDCLSLWVSNRLGPLGDAPSATALAGLERALAVEVERLIEAVRRRETPTIVVTNEVGGGLVPAYPLGRAYRDLLGRVNQHASIAADRAWLLVAGRPLELPSAELPAELSAELSSDQSAELSADEP